MLKNGKKIMLECPLVAEKMNFTFFLQLKHVCSPESQNMLAKETILLLSEKFHPGKEKKNSFFQFFPKISSNFINFTRALGNPTTHSINYRLYTFIK